jgi:hypothetical protein
MGIVAVLMNSAPCQAAIFGKVSAYSGDVKINGKAVTEVDQSIWEADVMETGASGRLVLKLADGSRILVSRSTQIESRRLLNDEIGDRELKLGRGRIRVQIMPSDLPVKPKFFIRTATASMGVRGTDFIGSFQTSGETEIVVLEGAAVFHSEKNIHDEVEVKAGHWGGIGGRFGSKMAPPKKLSADQLGGFEKELKF